MKQIPTSRGFFALVDDADYEWLSKMRWSYVNGYAVRNGTNMHRLITSAPVGMDVDHIDRNRLNNQRSNLRVCTHKENMQNIANRRDVKSVYKDNLSLR